MSYSAMVSKKFHSTKLGVNHFNTVLLRRFAWHSYLPVSRCHTHSCCHILLYWWTQLTQGHELNCSNRTLLILTMQHWQLNRGCKNLDWVILLWSAFGLFNCWMFHYISFLVQQRGGDLAISFPTLFGCRSVMDVLNQNDDQNEPSLSWSTGFNTENKINLYIAISSVKLKILQFNICALRSVTTYGQRVISM